jgi:hypothetical protein
MSSGMCATNWDNKYPNYTKHMNVMWHKIGAPC